MKIERPPDKEDGMSLEKRPQDAAEIREMVRDGYTNVAERVRAPQCGRTATVR